MLKYYPTILLSAAILFLNGCGDATPKEQPEFELHPDFAMELVASEPMIFDPVDMEFDEQGRAFVLEMPGYPKGVDQSRIIMLEDQDGDAKFDNRVVFAEDLRMATSLLPWKGGFLVAAPPDLLWIADTDGDNKADQRETLVSGFSEGNLQHNFNGLSYGLDNRVYAANGGNDGEIYWPDHEQKKLPIRGNDMRFDFSNQIMELVGRSSGGYEMTMDEEGHWFETHNMYHISNLVFPGKYIEGLSLNPRHSLERISDHNEGELSRVYALGLQEMRVNHPEQAGYFSGSCGITHYGGGAFGEEFQGNVFVADVVLNLIHRDVISEEGAGFKASRGREKAEFLASRDRAFRPVNMTVGPDGALYVLDMHRDVIEHPEWIPDEMEDTLDLDAGKDMGRIYRIAPRDGLATIRPTFDRNNPGAVVQAFEHPNQWHRITAQRLLVEWQDEAAVPLLEELFNQSGSYIARLHALHTLIGFGKADRSLLEKAIQDEAPVIRELAVRLMEQEKDFPDEGALKITELADDPHPRVRMQVALSLSGLTMQDHTEETLDALLAIAEKDKADPWMRMALAASMRSDPLLMLRMLMTHPDAIRSEGSDELLGMLSSGLGASKDTDGITAVVSSLANSDTKQLKVAGKILDGMVEGINRANHTHRFESRARGILTGALPRLEEINDIGIISNCWRIREIAGLSPAPNRKELLEDARLVVENKDGLPKERREQLALIGFMDYGDREDLLFGLLDSQEPQSLQDAAIRQIGEDGGISGAEKLIANWKTFTPETRRRASDILLYQKANHDLLLTALESGALSLGEMNFHLERRRRLLWSEDTDIAARAEKLFSDAGVVTRKEAMAQMRPAISMQGSPGSGQKVFGTNCAQCHRIGTVGKNVGPDLTDIFRKSGQSLLHDIIDPNAAVDTKYISHTIETNDGELIAGYIYEETDQQITLRQVNGEDRTVARRNIKSLQSSGLSLMPEGLEGAIDVQQMADLLAFLQEPR